MTLSVVEEALAWAEATETMAANCYICPLPFEVAKSARVATARFAQLQNGEKLVRPFCRGPGNSR